MNIFVIFMILLPIVLFIVELESLNSTTKIVLRVLNTILLLIGGGIVTVFVIILSMLSARDKDTIGVTTSSFTIVSILVFSLFIGIVWHLYKHKVFLILEGVLIFLFTALGISTVVRNNYIDNIPHVYAENVLYKYNPHSAQNELVLLGEPATIKFTGNYPVMDGATALYPVYAAFANSLYPNAPMEAYSYDTGCLRCTTTDGAYTSLIEGDADIIFVASPSKAQAEAAAAQGVELVFTPIGRECFVFFVNSKNRLDNITVEQVQQIYSGKITRWDELGVKRLGDIRPFQREEGSGSQTYLVRLMGDTPLLEPEMSEIIDAMSGVITKVADYKNFKNAIGYSFRFYTTEMAATNQIKLLSLEGVAPTKENIINGTYPLSGEFYAVTRSDCTPETKQLVDWILSEQGQRIIDQTGYVRLH